MTTATGVSDSNFDTNLSWTYYIDRNYRGNIESYVNATVEYEGFFQAPVDDEYELSFSNTDYNAISFLGSAPAADQFLKKGEVQFLKLETSFDHALLFNNTKDLGQTISTTQYLFANNYYPLRVVLAALSQHALLDFQIKLPNGTLLTQYQGYVYNFAFQRSDLFTVTSNENSSCTGSHTTLTTDSDGSTIVACLSTRKITTTSPELLKLS
ncbi:BA75_03324T0 [Komagataella pastoris]|uniref:BA75_03324T0 n=1 Tax=Komagataella pastoris TaxID=4922 RepID=A0A1B2JBW4_PICPA|nr:BA75_03324T0 [Komagataella pastoris]